MISCRTESYSLTPALTAQRDVDFLVTIPQSRIPLYADLSCYNLSGSESVDTKSVDEDTLVSLGSLLDLNAEKCYENGGIQYSQIPFSDNSDGRWSSYLYDNEIEYGEEGVSSSIRKFYVQTQKGDAKQSFIVTMITHNEYETRFPDYDYITKPNYSGIILFSNVFGVLNEMRSYNNGRVVRAKILSSSEVDTANDDDFHHFALFENEALTKSDPPSVVTLYDQIMPALHIMYLVFPEELNPSFCYAWNSSGGGGYSVSSPSGGNSNGPTLDHDVDPSDIAEENPPEEDLINISLSSNIPDDVNMIGSGSYTRGTWVAVGYEWKETFLTCVFEKWVGGFNRVETPFFLYKAEMDIEATAYFKDGTIYPCSDTTKRITNPVVDMKVAPSNAFGNYLGGTFGQTRTSKSGKPLYHYGLDLAVLPGTPIFAMYSGVVVGIRDDAPNKEVAKSYGNMIMIESEINNSGDANEEQIIRTLYAHLQYNNAIAINPRTGVPFKINDNVYQGELIGYSGKTGNAFNVPYAHLHLGILVDDAWVDPAQYINGVVNTATLSSTQGEIGDIQCDTGSRPVYLDSDVDEEDDEDVDEDL